MKIGHAFFAVGVIKDSAMNFPRNIAHRFARFAVWNLVHGYRRLLRRTVFIGVTGSSGKTTTKELIYAILSSRYRGTKTRETLNGLSAACRAVLKTKPWHRFCVIEMASGIKGAIARNVAMVPLDIGVIISIGLDHYTAFRGREMIAAEKEQVVTRLTSQGTAILNSDDPLIEDMAKRTKGKVIRVGENESADLRATGIRSVWPERLSFDIKHEGRTFHVRTRLCGIQWVPGVLSSIGTGLAMKVPMEDIFKVIETFEPFPGRMSTVVQKDGVTFICDDWKAPYWSIDHTLMFMREAKADRKIMVFGNISDTPGSTPPKYRRIARDALEIAALVIFVGNNAHYAVGQNEINPPAHLKMMETVKEVSEFLAGELRSGDLVILKGSIGSDHLLRIMLNREKEISCWRMDCRRVLSCTDCPLLYDKKAVNTDVHVHV